MAPGLLWHVFGIEVLRRAGHDVSALDKELKDSIAASISGEALAFYSRREHELRVDRQRAVDEMARARG